MLELFVMCPFHHTLCLSNAVTTLFINFRWEDGRRRKRIQQWSDRRERWAHDQGIVPYKTMIHSLWVKCTPYYVGCKSLYCNECNSMLIIHIFSVYMWSRSCVSWFLCCRLWTGWFYTWGLCTPLIITVLMSILTRMRCHTGVASCILEGYHQQLKLPNRMVDQNLLLD